MGLPADEDSTDPPPPAFEALQNGYTVILVWLEEYRASRSRHHVYSSSGAPTAFGGGATGRKLHTKMKWGDVEEPTDDEVQEVQMRLDAIEGWAA